MRRVAFTAMVFMLLIVAANIHTVGADQAQTLTHKTSVKELISKPQAGSKPAVKIVQASKPITPAVPAPVMVTVNDGDTLSSIAASNNTTVDRLFDANQAISDPNLINPGQQLRIPDANEQLPNRDMPATARTTTATAHAATSTAPAAHYAAVTIVPIVGNDAKAFIYGHESGNNPAATSPNGCFGLGQDCNGVVRNQCGVDYACQDAYFTNYALSRYGSWEGAAAFWQANGWW